MEPAEIGQANAQSALDYSKRDFESLYDAIVAHRDNVLDTLREYGYEHVEMRRALRAFDEYVQKRVSIAIRHPPKRGR